MSFDIALKRKRIIDVWNKHDTNRMGYLVKDSAFAFFKDAFKLFCGIENKDYRSLTRFGEQLGYKDNKIQKSHVEQHINDMLRV